MGKETGIQWADATVNFWHGCKKVSKGCKYCYMYRDKERYKQDPMIVVKAVPATFKQALSWKEPKRIFTCSWSDFFISDADEIKDKKGNFKSHWRKEAWDIIRQTPQHTWLILTKRPERILQCLPPDWGKGWDNVWIGVSVESQKTANFRIPKLFEVPCKIRFISAEPVLESIDISAFLHVMVPNPEGGKPTPVHPIHWVIIGGESGNDNGDYLYRPCKTQWLHEIVKQCEEQEVPVFVKQLGTSLAKQLDLKDRHGGDHNEAAFPQYLRIMEFPPIVI